MLETCICKENSLQMEEGIDLSQKKKKNTFLPAYLTQVTESNTNTRNQSERDSKTETETKTVKEQ